MKLQKHSFQKKLYLSCFLLNFIILIVCSVFFYYYTSRSLKQNMQDTVISSTSMLLKDMEGLLTDADNILKEIQTNPQLLSEAKKITDTSANYFSTHVPAGSAFQSTFRNVLISQSIEGSISFVSNYYDNVGVSTSPIGAHPYKEKEKLKENHDITKLLSQTDYITYQPPHRDYWGHDTAVMSVIRPIRDTYQCYGILELDLDITVLTDLLNDFENPENYSIALLDEYGDFVYATDAGPDRAELHNTYLRVSQEHVSEDTVPANGTSQYMESGTFSTDSQHLSCYEKSALTGWTFILSADTASYLSSTKQLLLVTSILFFSLFVIMSGFLYLVTKSLTKPLHQLTNQLTNLNPGRNINISEISSNNEITMLTNAVQAFLAEIYEQNQRLTEAKKRTLQAHYDAMEAQLNPHFLYNALSVIGMTGLDTGNTKVSKMCSELASLLRYSLSYTGQSVRLEQEIINARTYLYLMKMRYEDDLVCEWNLDSAIDSLNVPKLILQPLLENCFQHGFQQTEIEIPPPWIIRIQSWHDDSRWYLSVTNNGAPFDSSKLRQLYERVEQFKLPETTEEKPEEFIMRQGFGLENTILRLNIFYHEQEYFQVSSSTEKWTAITIGGPLKPSGLFRHK